MAADTDDDAGPCFTPVASGECVEIGTCNEIAGCVETPIADGANFSVNRPLTNCISRRTKILCASPDKRVRAKFSFKPRTPLLTTMNVVLRGLDTDEAGNVPPSGMISATVNQGLATRSDVIGDVKPCRALGRWRWDCAER